MRALLFVSLLVVSSTTFAVTKCYTLINNQMNRELCIDSKSPSKASISVKAERARCLPDIFEAVKVNIPGYKEAYEVTKVLKKGCGNLGVVKNSEFLFMRIRDIQNPRNFLQAVQITTPEGTWSLEARPLRR